MSSSLLDNLSSDPAMLASLTSEQRDRLAELLDRYLMSLEQGVPLAQTPLLDEHPDLAPALRVYFEHLNSLHEVTAGMARPAGGLSDLPAQGDDNGRTSSVGSKRASLDHSSDDALLSFASAPGRRQLGDFLLGDEIGRGGMGVVYEAQQISLGRRVALKVLPFASVLDNKQIARFKNEARAAAQLHHPHIVPVFAVGEERGVHYYAMQYIEGQTLEQAISELRSRRADSTRPGPASNGDTRRASRGPTTRIGPNESADENDHVRTAARLGVEAAEALHAAHEMGVVHRDIKPSNLLLDRDGHLWVTDFGLARVQSEAALSRTGDIVGTLRYMSPEQARGQVALVDARSDVYSLGITLYELLALRPAFTDDDRQALLRGIESEEPPRLSSLCKDLPSDLETVIHKAMAKSRDERYATAQEFADDLRRVLAGQPTRARPATTVDRLSRWTRRHRGWVLAIAAAGVLTVVGSTSATLLVLREKVQAERNFARAERNFRDARDAVDRFGTRLAEQLADVPGAEQERLNVLREARNYYERFVAQAGDDRVLRAEIATAFAKIGALADGAGATDDAVVAFENAIRLLNDQPSQVARPRTEQRQLAIYQNNLALIFGRAGRLEEALDQCRAAISLQQDLSRAPSPDEYELRRELAQSQANLGWLATEQGDSATAITALREALRLQEQLRVESSEDGALLRSLASTLNSLAALYLREQPERATALYEQALEHQRGLVERWPNDRRGQVELAQTCSNLGSARSRRRQFPEAITAFEEAISLQQRLVDAYPNKHAYQLDLAVSYNNLGMTQLASRQPAQAEQSFRHALEHQLPVESQRLDDVGLQSQLGGVYNNLGRAQEELGLVEQAAESFARAVEYQQRAFDRAKGVARFRENLSKSLANYGRVLRRLERDDEAQQALETRRRLEPSSPATTRSRLEGLDTQPPLIDD